MIQTVINIFLLAGLTLLVWWLTGIDLGYTGESQRHKRVARGLRTGSVMLLVGAIIFLSEDGAGAYVFPIVIFLAFCIAALTFSSVSELATGGFIRLLDPHFHDGLEVDLKSPQRCMDAIAHLIKEGRREEAIRLCEKLKETNTVDARYLNDTLEFLGVKRDAGRLVRPMQEAGRLRKEGKFAEAETFLQSLLVKNPADADAAMMLMRLYAQDLRLPSKAAEVLQAFEKQPHVSAAHVEFARRSINDWSQNGSQPIVKPDEVQAAEPETLEALIAAGFVGTAIERLEAQAAAEPRNFDVLLQLAELHAVQGHNLPRAEKIVRGLELNPAFTKEQAAAARARLKEWQNRPLQRK